MPAGSSAARPGLDRDAIVAAAIVLADREGFGAVSMRRLAAELGVGTMSLYWHVPTREDLLDLMFDRAVGAQVLEEVPTDWRVALEQIARRARRVFEQTPWVNDIGVRPRLGVALLRHVEQSAEVAASMGLPIAEGMLAVGAVDDYVLGYVLSEHARPRSVPALTGEAAARVEAGDFPTWSALVAAVGPSPSAEQEFETGLALLLDGISAAIAAGKMPGMTTARRRTHA